MEGRAGRSHRRRRSGSGSWTEIRIAARHDGEAPTDDDTSPAGDGLPRVAGTTATESTASNPPNSPQPTSARSRWARLLARIYDAFPLLCPDCGAEMRILASVTSFTTPFTSSSTPAAKRNLPPRSRNSVWISFPLDHRLFSEITKNWAARPLDSFETVIVSTRTKAGLEVRARLVEQPYLNGFRVSKEQMNALDIEPHTTQPNRNYTLYPRVS